MDGLFIAYVVVVVVVVVVIIVDEGGGWTVCGIVELGSFFE